MAKEAQNEKETIAQEKEGAKTEVKASENQTETQEELTENEQNLSEVEVLEQKLQEQKEKYLRLFADFDNFKKRNAKERLELLNTAGKDIILSIIPTIDDFERAILAAENAKDITSVKEGMVLIKNKMMSQLQQRGLKAMESVGESFDASKHEAITEIPAPSEEMKGKVVDQIEKGYMLNEKIIRYAKVVVGK